MRVTAIYLGHTLCQAPLTLAPLNLQNFLLRSANASIFHETSAQRRQGLIANKWLTQKLKFTCTHVQILHWPKSAFVFLVTFHGKTRMNFLADPIQWLFHGFFLFFLQLKPQVIATPPHKAHFHSFRKGTFPGLFSIQLLIGILKFCLALLWIES